MRATLLPVLILAAAALSGCIRGDPHTDVHPAASDDCPGCPTQTLGGVEGLVTDDEFVPIPDAQVALSGAPGVQTARTDADGYYVFLELQPGLYQLVVSHPNHSANTTAVTLVAGEIARADVRLVLLPSLQPYSTTTQWTGHYDCGMEAVILTGDCLVAYQEVDPAGDPVTNETNYHFFTVGEHWAQLVVELTWTAGSQHYLDGLHLYATAGNESRNAADHHTKYALAEGPRAPLRIDLFPDTAHPLAENWPETTAKAVLGSPGGDVLLLVYPRGMFSYEVGQVCDPTSPDRCFLGVGAAVDLDFTAYVTVFYNAPAPEGFTALDG